MYVREIKTIKDCVCTLSKELFKSRWI